MAVLALLVLFVTSFVNTAATVTTLGNKRMDADAQARQLLDRMAVDFAQMVKRDDLDLFSMKKINKVLKAKDAEAGEYIGEPTVFSKIIVKDFKIISSISFNYFDIRFAILF